MGNIASSLLLTPQEKEVRKLTKKNTKMNRTALGSGEASVSQPAMRRDPARKTKLRQAAAAQPLRFENLITEVTYDREEGEIETLREPLNFESHDTLGDDVLLDLVPTQVPVVNAHDAHEHPSSLPQEEVSSLPPHPSSPAQLPPARRQGGLKRDSSFIVAHASRHTAAAAAASAQVAGEMAAEGK